MSQIPSPKESATDEDGQSLRLEVDRNAQPRFFRAGEGSARGKTGSEDLAEFVKVLELLQESSVRIGNQLEMHAVSHCVAFEENQTSAFRFDPDSDPQRPMVSGALVNRQMPVKELLAAMSDR